MVQRKVKGQLVFSVSISGRDKPLHNMEIELYDLDLVGDDFLARGRTDREGRFELTYDSRDAGRFDEPDLVLKVVSPEWTYDKQGNVEVTNRVIACFDAGDDITDAVFDFGVRRIGYWEYEDEEDESKVAFTPRVAIVNGEVPQDQRCGLKMTAATVAAPVLPRFAKHKLINKFDQNAPSPETLADDYPENLTRRMDREQPGSSRTDAYLCDIVLNGFNPCLLKRGEDNDFFVDFRWDGYEQDGVHFGPNSTGYFRLADDRLTLDRILIQKRVGGDANAHARMRRPKNYTAESPVWDRIKHIFRVNYFFFGEAITHLAGTHLNLEQYAVPLMRNLRLNPVARLLFPHYYGTVSINKYANAILIDENGLVGSTSPATPRSVAQMVRDSFAQFNWYGWKPREAVCSSHRFATLSQLYWSVLSDYVDWFFAENDAGIRQHWHEVHLMSRELVAHAVPYHDQQDTVWADTNEVNTADKPHPVIDGVRVAVSPITHSDTVDDAGLENLKQMCRYLIFHATFKHSWVNDSQYDLGGDVLFATLGLIDDITNAEIDHASGVRASDALNHPFITSILSSVKYGYIMRNEDRDIHPKLQELLVARKQAFREQAFNIRNIRSTINI